MYDSDDSKPDTADYQSEKATAADECSSPEHGNTESKDDTLDGMEHCSDIDRLHKHVTELQNTMAKEKVEGKINIHDVFLSLLVCECVSIEVMVGYIFPTVG